MNGSSSKITKKAVRPGAIPKALTNPSPRMSRGRPLQCPDCSYNSYNYISFAYHLIDHQQTNVLNCCFCGFKANIHWMGLHMKKHISKKAFNCLYCSFSTEKESSFRSHVERAHQNNSERKHELSTKGHQEHVENSSDTKGPVIKGHQWLPENQNSSNKQALVRGHQENFLTDKEGTSMTVSGDDEMACVEGPYDLGPGDSGPHPDQGRCPSSPLKSTLTLSKTPETHIPPSVLIKPLDPGQSHIDESPALRTAKNGKKTKRASSGKSSHTKGKASNLDRPATTNSRKIFKCNVCSFSTLNGSLINLHIKEHYVIPQPELNQWGTETTGSSRSQVSQPVNFKCDKCHFTTHIKTLFERHSVKHLIDPSFVCPHCGLRETRAVEFTQHLASKHRTGRRFHCCYCGYSSPKLRYLGCHIEIHRSVRLFDCPECEMSFSRNCRLNDHIRKRHMKGKQTADDHLLQSESEKSCVAPDSISLYLDHGPVQVNGAADSARISAVVTKQERRPRPAKTKVSVPSKPAVLGSLRPSAMTIKKRKQLPGRMRTKANVRSKPSGTASIISAAFSINESLHEPIRIGVNVPAKPLYQCSSCNFSTKRKDLLRLHVAKHLLPESYLVCPICKFSEISTHSFVAHLITHESRLRLKCCYCDYISKKPKELRRHVEMHRSVHFYDCPICGKTYTQFTNLRLHCKKAHVKNVQCPDCGKVTTKAKLHSHRRAHRLKLLKQKRQGSQKSEPQSKSEPVLEAEPKPKTEPEPNAKPNLKSEPDSEPDPQLVQCAVNDSTVAAADGDMLCTNPRPTTMRNPQTRSSANIQQPDLAYEYICNFCNYGTNIKRLHAHHEAKHSMEGAMFVCPDCQFKSGQLMLFYSHLVSHHNSNHCFCGFKASCKNSFMRHLESHRTVHFNDCSMCDRSYARQDSLIGHYSKYHVQKNVCPDCGKCMTYLELIEHNKLHKSMKAIQIHRTLHDMELVDPSLLRCYHCKYISKKKSLLRRHIVKHFMDTRIVCPYGDFCESNAREFAKHCISCQGGFICSFCSYSTGNVSNLIEHVETHRNIAIYDCAKCEHSSSTRHGLRDHIKSMHVALHKCSFCDKTMSRYRLKRHELKHRSAEMTLTDAEDTPAQQPLHEESSPNDAVSFGLMIDSGHSIPSIAPKNACVDESLLCGYCDFISDTRALLEEHLSLHVEQQTPLPFVTESEPFPVHVPTDSSVLGRLMCRYCRFSTDDESSLEDHLGNHTIVTIVNAECEPNSGRVVPKPIALDPDARRVAPETIPMDPDSPDVAPKKIPFDSDALNVPPETIDSDPDLTNFGLDDPTPFRSGSEMDIEYFDNHHKSEDNVDASSMDNDVEIHIDHELSGFTVL